MLREMLAKMRAHSGFLGGDLIPPETPGDEYQLVVRFASEAELQAWDMSEARLALLERMKAVADELGARTVAFPLVSAGAYGWPKTDAIDAALEVFRSAQTQVTEARMVAFDHSSYAAIQAALRRS